MIASQPMDNNVEKDINNFCDNCQDFGNCRFRKEGKYEIIIS